MQLEKRKGRELVLQSKSYSGMVGRQMVGAGVLLAVGHVAAILLPVLTSGFFGSWLLVPILLGLGWFLAE